MLSNGRRSISARTTVSPPTPESNTPIGREAAAALIARPRSRNGCGSKQHHRGELALAHLQHHGLASAQHQALVLGALAVDAHPALLHHAHRLRGGGGEPG